VNAPYGVAINELLMRCIAECTAFITVW